MITGCVVTGSMLDNESFLDYSGYRGLKNFCVDIPKQIDMS